MSFNDMMQQAIQIRTSTDAKLRTDFDARPKFQQTSMFATQEVRAARGLPLEERLARCSTMKVEGNEQMRNDRFEDACHTYEQALGILWFLRNRNKDWKSRGIKDEDIEEVNFSPVATDGHGTVQRVRDLKVALLLNIARAYFSRNDHVVCKQACDAAMSVDPSSVKALHLRAKAVLSPASAGGFELDEAIRNLSRAAELAPEDGVVRLHLSKLKLQKAKQAEKDRTTFAGMFARGSVCDQRRRSEPERIDSRLFAPPHGVGSITKDTDLKDRELRAASSNTGVTKKLCVSRNGGNDVDCGGGGSDEERKQLAMRKDLEMILGSLTRLARECDQEDKEEEAHRYRERIADVREALARYDEDGGQRAVIRTGSDPDPSHANGSQRHSAGWQTLQRIRKRAAEDEIDLDHPAVIEFLARLQYTHDNREKLAKAKMKRIDPSTRCRGRTDREHDDGNEPGLLEDFELERDNNDDMFGRNTQDGDDWGEEIYEGAIRCMSRSEVLALLEEVAVSPASGLTLVGLRNLALEKVMPQAHRPELKRAEGKEKNSLSLATAPGANKRNEKQVNWKLSLSITLVIFLIKSYQMGLFKWLLTEHKSSVDANSWPTGKRHSAAAREFGEGGEDEARTVFSGDGSTLDGNGVDRGVEVETRSSAFTSNDGVSSGGSSVSSSAVSSTSTSTSQKSPPSCGGSSSSLDAASCVNAMPSSAPGPRLDHDRAQDSETCDSVQGDLRYCQADAGVRAQINDGVRDNHQDRER